MPPAPAYDPIPDWLRETRLSEHRPDGEPWTQDDLIEAMRAEVGWAPHRPNYSRYESGKSKPAKTLPKFIEFWAKRGKPGPDYTPPEAAAPPVDPIAAAIDRLGERMERAIAARDEVIAALLQELATYRRQTVDAQQVERSLIQALPGALADALAATQGIDPASGSGAGDPRRTVAGR